MEYNRLLLGLLGSCPLLVLDAMIDLLRREHIAIAATLAEGGVIALLHSPTRIG